MSKDIMNLKTDEALKRLVAPLSQEVLCRMEQDLARGGCCEPLSIWNRIVLVDHDRYAIYMRRQISFSIQRIALKNREEAIIWICLNQLNRHDISEENRKYLIGKRYETEKMLAAHNAASANGPALPRGGAMPSRSPFGPTACHIREKMAEEYDISPTCILNYGRYARTMDFLSEIVPQVIPRLLSGEIRISQRNIAALSKLTGQNAKRLRQIAMEDASVLNSGDEIHRLFSLKNREVTAKTYTPTPPGSIKNMPSYDPDAEISSLTFTIPSWISSIDRVRTAANLEYTTERARNTLEEELVKLKKAIDAICAVLKETF